MLTNDKVVVEVGANEATMRSQNENVPYTPEEIAEDARRCYDAGASVYHYHARGPHGEPRHDDPQTNMQVQHLIEKKAPLIAYPTYGEPRSVLDGYYTISPPAEERYAHMIEGVRQGVEFEIGSFDMGAAFDLNAHRNAETGEWTLSEGHQINTGRDHLWLMNFAREHKIKMTLAVFDTLHLDSIRNMVDMGWFTRPPLLIKLFVVGRGNGQKKLLYMVDRMNELLGHMNPSWMSVGYFMNQFPTDVLALTLGGHVRVGVGDYPYKQEGEPSNAELVEQIVTIARAMGREPATPDEVREIHGINAAKRGEQ